MPVEYGPDETRDKHLSNSDFTLLIEHLYSPGAHGSTPENMEGRIVRRDAEGRAKVSDPKDDDDIATKGYVDQSLSSFGGVPRGIITMWSGAIADIPSGWALCDGSNGTPDLRDRFIVGAGESYNVGDTGGSNTVTLTTSQIPSHSHTASIDQAGDHSHGMGTRWTVDGLGDGWEPDSERNGPGFLYGYEERTTGQAGEHSHSITISSTGDGQAHENRPPYYALAYIMKL
jgi:microcystin-dependent protein